MRKLMTKLFFVLALLGVAAVAADAQTIGVKLGPTFSKLNIEDAPDSDDGGPETLTSFGGGGFIRFGLGGLNLQAELLALTKGASQSVEDPDFGEATFKLKLNYIEIPITAMFPVGPGYVFAGPSVAFEVSCEVQFESDDIDVEGDDCDEGLEEDEMDRASTDFSLHGGAGFEFAAGPGRILLEGRYIWGLTDLNESDDPDSFGFSKNRTWAFFVGYAVRL